MSREICIIVSKLFSTSFQGCLYCAFTHWKQCCCVAVCQNGTRHSFKYLCSHLCVEWFLRWWWHLKYSLKCPETTRQDQFPVIVWLRNAFSKLRHLTKIRVNDTMQKIMEIHYAVPVNQHFGLGPSMSSRFKRHWTNSLWTLISMYAL